MEARDILSRQIRLRFQNLQYHSENDSDSDDSDDDWSNNEDSKNGKEDYLNNYTEPIKIVKGRVLLFPLLHL